MAYIGKSPQNGVRNRFVYAATQGQTAFTGADADSKTLVVSDQLYTDVYQNGVKLKLTTDWTATATTVTLVNAASADDVIEIVSFDVFSVSDTVPASTGGAFAGAISATSYGAVSGTTGTFSGAVSGTTGAFSSTVNSQQSGGGLVNLYRTYANTTGLMGSINSGNTDWDSALAGIDFHQDGSKTNARIGFFTQPTGGAKTERMRIASDGDVSIGGTTATAAFNLVGTGGSNVQIQNNIAPGTNTFVSIGFINDNGLIGSIQCGGSSTSYATSSDYRMKENVDYTWDATTRLKQLKPARFNFIADDTNTLIDGFIAHEVSSIVPEAVTGAKDAMAVETRYTADDVETQGDTPSKNVGDPKTYSSTKIDPQGIDQSKLVPLLVKTIQELEARLTAGGL